MEENSTLKNSSCAADKGEKMDNNTLNSTNAGSPSRAIINNILSYSKALTVIKTRQLGKIDMLMN